MTTDNLRDGGKESSVYHTLKLPKWRIEAEIQRRRNGEIRVRINALPKQNK